jgi:hypothetical protein
LSTSIKTLSLAHTVTSSQDRWTGEHYNGLTILAKHSQTRRNKRKIFPVLSNKTLV